MAEAPEKRPNSATTFWKHRGLMLANTVEGFDWVRDMLLGTAISVATLGMQVHWGLITSDDWQAHKWKWILSIASPYVLVIGGHFVYRSLMAPWRVYRTQKDVYERKIDECESALSAAKADLQEHIEKQDAPELVVDWQWEKNDFGSLGLPKRYLWLHNNSPSEDVFNVQIEPTSLSERVVANFKAIARLERGQSAQLRPSLHVAKDGSICIRENDDFDFVIFGAMVQQVKDLPEENYYLDANKHEHVRVPIFVNFSKYGGKSYRAKFFFDTNTDTHEDTIKFVEVVPTGRTS